MDVKEFTYPYIQCTKPDMIYDLCIIIDFRQIHNRIFLKTKKNILKVLEKYQQSCELEKFQTVTVFVSTKMLLVKIAKKSHQMKGFITEQGVVSLGTHAYPWHFHLIHDLIIK